MMRFVELILAGLRNTPQSFGGIRFPAPTQAWGVISVIGLAVLCYVAGAAVMHFQLPTGDYLKNAFKGGEAWSEWGKPNPLSLPPAGEMAGRGVVVDEP